MSTLDNRHHSLHDTFRRFAASTSAAAGSIWTFGAAALFLLLWACSYPLFLGFHDPINSWQLVVNTVTTVITFLMVFLIQNTQNRDAKALHLKLDELIRAVHGARNHLVDLEDCSDEELDQLKQEFNRLRTHDDSTTTQNRTEKQIANVEVEEQNRQV